MIGYDSWKTRSDRDDGPDEEFDPEAAERNAEEERAMIAIEEAITHPNYSHSRRGDGCWRDVVWIYHRDVTSPSGVKLAASGDAGIVEPMLRDLVNNSPLSPTER